MNCPLPPRSTTVAVLACKWQNQGRGSGTRWAVTTRERGHWLAALRGEAAIKENMNDLLPGDTALLQPYPSPPRPLLTHKHLWAAHEQIAALNPCPSAPSLPPPSPGLALPWPLSSASLCHHPPILPNHTCGQPMNKLQRSAPTWRSLNLAHVPFPCPLSPSSPAHPPCSLPPIRT